MKSNAQGNIDTFPQPVDRASAMLAELHEHAAAMRDLLARIDNHVSDQHMQASDSGDAAEAQRLATADPFAWLAQAKHSMQAGVMFAARALHQPTDF